jgi:hypothetical protein
MVLRSEEKENFSRSPGAAAPEFIKSSSYDILLRLASGAVIIIAPLPSGFPGQPPDPGPSRNFSKILETIISKHSHFTTLFPAFQGHHSFKEEIHGQAGYGGNFLGVVIFLLSFILQAGGMGLVSHLNALMIVLGGTLRR